MAFDHQLLGLTKVCCYESSNLIYCMSFFLITIYVYKSLSKYVRFFCNVKQVLNITVNSLYCIVMLVFYLAYPLFFLLSEYKLWHNNTINYSLLIIKVKTCFYRPCESINQQRTKSKMCLLINYRLHFVMLLHFEYIF